MTQSRKDNFDRNIALPMIADILRFQKGYKNAISNKKIRQILHDRNIYVSDTGMRGIIHEIRLRGLVKRLIASQKGYYVSHDYEEVVSYIQTIQGRITSMNNIINSLERQVTGIR